jgi:uncharacterized SAM-binding protein YcdF (DUF218 family)
MKLAISKQGAAVGAAAGGLAGFFLAAFGMKDISGGLSDPMMVTIGLALGALVGLTGGQWILLALNGLFVIVYLVVGYTPLTSPLVKRWVREDPLPVTADAIVVLSGTVLSDTALNVDGTERLLSGLELFQRGLAPRLFTTKVEREYPIGVISSTRDQERLIGLAGARAAWTVLEPTRNTHDEALRAASKLPPGGRSLIVVTSPMHTRRACATFETVGFKVTCYPSLTRRRVTGHPIREEDRLAAFGEYLYERLGMVKYRWKHWIPLTA